MNTAELMARDLSPIGTSINLNEVKASSQPVEEVTIDADRAANVEVISRDIVYRAALEDALKGDRLSFIKPDSIPNPKARKAVGFLKAVGNSVIRGFETVTGIKTIRAAENQMLATRALEMQLAGKQLNDREQGVLKKLNLSRFIEIDGREKLAAEVEAGRSLQTRRDALVNIEEQEAGLGKKILKFLTGKLDEQTIRGIYLKSVDLEGLDVSARNERLRSFVTTTVVSVLGLRLLQAKTAGVSWVLGAGVVVGMTGYRAYQRSNLSTQEFLNKVQYKGIPNAPYVCSEGINQTMAWGGVIANAKKIGAYFNAAQRLENNDFITRVISSGDMQSLGESMRTGNTDAAIELLAANAVRMLFNEGGDIERMAKLIEEAEDVFMTLGDDRFSQLNARIAFLSSRKEALKETVTAETLRDVKRAMVMSVTFVSLGSFLRDFLQPETVEAHEAETIVTEKPVIIEDLHEEAASTSNFQLIEDKPDITVLPDTTPTPTTFQTEALTDEELRFIKGGNTLGIESPTIQTESAVEVFGFNTSGATEIAKDAKAYLFRSDASFFHNVFRSNQFKPDFQIRIPSKFGPGDGTFTPLQENMHVSLGPKFHDELKGLLIQKGILKTGDYKPENVGYTVYIKEGNHNQVLTVTRDSNISGLKIDKDGNLDMDPSIQAKVDGFSVVYVDKSADNLKGIYNIGRIINAKGHQGDAEFMTVDKDANPGGLPAESGGLGITELEGSFNLGDDIAPMKLAEHGATMITIQDHEPSIVKDFASGAFKINDQPIPTNSVHTFQPDTNEITFSDTMAPEELIKKFDKAVDAAAGEDITMHPEQLKWQLWFFDPTTHKYIKVIVDKNTNLSGIKVTDSGLVLDPSISKRLVEVDKIYQGPSKTIILEKANVKSYSPADLPDFLDVKTQ